MTFSNDLDIDAMMARGLSADPFLFDSDDVEDVTSASSPHLSLLFTDDDDEDVRELAAKLAPQVKELESLLFSPSVHFSTNATPTSINSNTYYTDDSCDNDGDDDSMDQEMERLAVSEQILRQELEFAHDFGEIMSTPATSPEKGVIQHETLQPDKELLQPTTPSRPEPGPAPHLTTPQQRIKTPYTLYDHSHVLGLLKEPRGGWYVLPQKRDGSIRDYVIPLPEKELLRLYVGLLNSEEQLPPESTQSTTALETLPVRIVAIKVRPDVLVGALMEGVASACNEHGDMERRQGGHITCIVDQTLRVDIQVCTYKGSGGRFCERTVLMRFYIIPSSQRSLKVDEADSSDNTATNLEANLALKEAAALVQKMEAKSLESIVGNSFFSPCKHTVHSDKKTMRAAVRSQLIQNHKACPSVQSGYLTLPALSPEDWPYLCQAWLLVEHIWEELDSRDLSFSSLDRAPFGLFPALPTVDVHYCSQLRRVCRENMIVSLLKSASELEDYAKEAEYACASLVQFLKPTFEMYQLTSPALPSAMPLTAYPLEFTPHQASCPPWGVRVMAALNKIGIMDQVAETSFDRAEKSVQMVLDAFQLQDDEELSARLGRKNVQVMDRLAKMQAHKRDCIDKISQSYSKSIKASKVADEYHHFAMKAGCHTAAEEQVPLFKCSILVGTATTGTCYVTTNRIMCVTQLIPILGENTVTLLNLDGLEFVVQDATTMLLNPLPAGISIRQKGVEVYSFRPSYGAARMKGFLEIVQALGAPHPLKFSDRGGMLYMYGDSSPTKESRKK